MAKVKVYRVGKLEVGKHSEDLADFWGKMDALKPDTHPTGRGNAIYVSPNLHSLRRWVRSAMMMNDNIEVHEVTVDSDDVYCYRIPAYEGVPTSSGSRSSERFVKATELFWKSGVTLTEWLASSPDAEESMETEILLGEQSIISSKKLTYGMVTSRLKQVSTEDQMTHLRRSKDMYV